MSVKAALRQSIKARLRTLPPAVRRNEAECILHELEECPEFRAACTVVLYYSLPDEVPTHDFVARTAQDKAVLLPVVHGDDLELRRFTTPADIAPGPYGIGEPTGETFTEMADIDLIVVPGVAFDAAGRRLGRGKGYYDRFLSHPALQRASRIGICFPCQLVSEVPAEPHDVPMHRVIS